MVRPLSPDLEQTPLIGPIAQWLNELCDKIQDEIAWWVQRVYYYFPEWLKRTIDWVWRIFYFLGENVYSFFSDPVEYLKKLADKVWEVIPDWVKKPIEWILGLIDLTVDKVKKFFQDPVGTIEELKNLVWGAMPKEYEEKWRNTETGVNDLREKTPKWLDEKTDTIKKSVEEARESLEIAFTNGQTAISESLTRIFPDPLNTLANFFRLGPVGIWRGLTNFFFVDLPASISSIFSILTPANLLSNMSNLSNIASSISGHFRSSIDSFLDTLKKFQKGELDRDPFEAYAKLVRSASEQVIKMEMSTMAMEMAMGWKYSGLGGAMGAAIASTALDTAVGATSGSIVDALLQPAKNWLRESIRGNFPPIPDAMRMFQRGKITMTQFENVLKWMGMSDEWFEGYKSLIYGVPSIYDGIKMVQREKITTDKFETILKWIGLSNEWFEGYRELIYDAPSISEAMKMYLRGKITEEQFEKVLKWAGIAREWFDGYKELIWYYPTVDDLIRFFVREAIPAVHGDIARRKLAEMPREMYEYGKKAGLPAEWVEAYWASHWVLPSTEQVYEMLWRGLTSPYTGQRMTIEDVATFLKEADIDPRWRENLIQIAYRLPGRVEARWGLEWGIWPLQKFEEFIRAEGVHPDWVGDVLAAEKANVFREHISAVASVLRRKFREGYLTSDEIRARLKKLGYPDDAIALILEASQEEYDFDWKEEMKKAYISAFEKDAISADELRRALINLGLTGDRVDQIIEIETLKKEKRPPPEETLERRLERLKQRRRALVDKLADLRTDLEDQNKLLDQEKRVWNERIEHQKYRIQIAPSPEAKAKEEAKLEMLNESMRLAILRRETRIRDLEESIRLLEARLEELDAEIRATEQALKK